MSSNKKDVPKNNNNLHYLQTDQNNSNSNSPTDLNTIKVKPKKLNNKTSKKFFSPNTPPTTLFTSSIPTANKPSRSRPSQACDRCRSKKIRCDLKKPHCSSCLSVGFECKFTDKLLRKTYPRGYTESLEERIRELEAENRKLSALSDMKQQHIDYLLQQQIKNNLINVSSQPIVHPLPSTTNTATNTVTSNFQPCATSISDSNHICNGMCRQNVLHPQPVATNFNLNDPTSISFEQDRAPGLSAAKALDSLSNHEESTQLAMLVSLSVPRSTEEILFVPQLLSKIRQEYGFTSKQCLYTVTLLASLKDDLPPPFLKQNSMLLLNCSKDLDTLANQNLWQIQNLHHFINIILRLDILSNVENIQILKKSDTRVTDNKQFNLTFDEIDSLINLFFDRWSPLIPVLSKEDFLNDYTKFKKDITSLQKLSVSSQTINNLLNIKYIACLLVVICQMGMLINFKEFGNTLPFKFSKLVSYYHRILYVLPRNPFFAVTTTSIRTLQLLSLLLYYFLNTGDIIQLYELRGKVVTMSQQLRLHRCPSAVLTGSGQKMTKLEQSNRRRLFWCIYYLDVFSSFQLGVPRLLKDHEIECALPLPLENSIDQTCKVKLEGYMTNFSLAIIRFAKILGNILDSIFKRTTTINNVVQTSTIHENALDGWRKSLPTQYQMELDVTGRTKLDNLTFEKNLLIILFQLAKCMIQLPICAAAMIPVLTNDPNTNGNVLPSYTALQQSVITLLASYSQLKDKYIPLPVNTSRVLTRFALIGAKESLEYTKYGNSFESNKKLLLGVVNDIEVNRRLELPGVISWYSLEMLDLTINFILQTPVLKGEKLERFLQKKIDYYQSQMGVTPVLNTASSSKKHSRKISSSQETKSDKNKKKTKASNRSKKSNSNNSTTTTTNVTAASSNNNNNNINTKGGTLYIPGEINKANTKLNDTSQNQLLEALQEDPILNGNPCRFSNLNLSNFFGSYIGLNEKMSTDNNDATLTTDIKIEHVPPSLSNSIDTVNSTTSPSYFTQTNLGNSNNWDNNLLNSHLSSISFSNLLPITCNDKSLSQFNMNKLYDVGNLFVSNSGKDNTNPKNTKCEENGNDYTLFNNVTNNTNTSNINPLTDFDSIIDASLGLAPLLHGNTLTNSKNDNIDNIDKIDCNSKDISNSNLNGSTQPINNDFPPVYNFMQSSRREGQRQVIDDISRWQNQ